MEVRVGRDGVEAPSSPVPGMYQFRCLVEGDDWAYIDIVQPPAGRDRVDVRRRAVSPAS